MSTQKSAWKDMPGQDNSEIVQCEWTVSSYYRIAHCSRDARKNIWGLSLCWQHEDTLLSTVVGKIRHNEYAARHLDDIAEALLSAKTRTGDEYNTHHHFQQEQTVAYIKILMQKSYIPLDISEALDQLIAQRISEGLACEVD